VQAALLAQKDSVTPLMVVLMTSSINLLGDYLLIAVGGTAMHIRAAANGCSVLVV
jgi:Na+-driven multidrug efflux pump